MISNRDVKIMKEIFTKSVKDFRMKYERESAKWSVGDFGPIWNERDLSFYLAYSIQNEIQKKLRGDYEVHQSFGLRPNSFNNPQSKEMLTSLQKSWYRYQLKYKYIKKKKSEKSTPYVDLMVSKYDSSFPLLLAAELKYYHYAVDKRYGRNPKDEIEKDLDRLEILLKEKICKLAGFVYLDACYSVSGGDEDKKLYRKLIKLANEYQDENFLVFANLRPYSKAT